MQSPRQRTPTAPAAPTRIPTLVPSPLLLLLLPLALLPMCGPRETAAAALDGGAAATGTCEPIRIPMCWSMPWNMTSLPNHLHQSSQHNALLSIEQYGPLADIGCSPLLSFYLCAMYAPICLINGGSDAPVPPCRRVCESVRAACEPVVRRHGRHWPDAFSCDGLPTYEEGVCISPEAIAPQPEAAAATATATSSPSAASSPALSSARSNGREHICEGGLKFRKSIYLAKSYDYTIRVRYDGQREAASGDARRTANATGIVVSVVRVLRKTNRFRESGLRINSTAVIWIPPSTQSSAGHGGAGCSPLRRGKEYIVACYTDPRDGRLLFDARRCMLARWKDGWTRTVREWNRLAEEALKLAERRPMSSVRPAPSTTQIADQLH